MASDCLHCGKYIGYSVFYHRVTLTIIISKHHKRECYYELHTDCLKAAKKSPEWQDESRIYTVGERVLDTLLDCIMKPDAA